MEKYGDFLGDKSPRNNNNNIHGDHTGTGVKNILSKYATYTHNDDDDGSERKPTKDNNLQSHMDNTGFKVNRYSSLTEYESKLLIINIYNTVFRKSN
jgi:hypothetical protein